MDPTPPNQVPVGETVIGPDSARSSQMSLKYTISHCWRTDELTKAPPVGRERLRLEFSEKLGWRRLEMELRAHRIDPRRSEYDLTLSHLCPHFIKK